MDFTGGQRSVSIRKVHDRRRALAKRFVEGVPYHANYPVLVLAEAQPATEWLCAPEIAVHERLVDDGLPGRCRIAEGREIGASCQGNAECAEVITRDDVEQRLILTTVTS